MGIGSNVVKPNLPGLAKHYIAPGTTRAACGVAWIPPERATGAISDVDCRKCLRTRIFRRPQSTSLRMPINPTSSRKRKATKQHRAPRLFVIGVTPEQWTKRYGVEPFSYPCYVCGCMLTTTRPFVQGTLRGLQAPTCACGDEKTPYAVVRDKRYGDLLDCGGDLSK